MNRSPANAAVVRGIQDLPAPRPQPVWTLRLAEDASAPRRFIHGFLLHLIVAASMLKDPAARRRYVKATAVQVIVTVVLALLFLPVQRYVREATREVEREAEAALQQTLGVVQSGLAAATDRDRAEEATDRVRTSDVAAGSSETDRDALVASLQERAKEFRLEVEALRVAETPPVPPVPPVRGMAGVPPVPPMPAPPEVDAPEVPIPPVDQERLAELVERARESAEEARALAQEGQGSLAQVKQLQAAAAMHQREAEQARQQLQQTLRAHEARLAEAVQQLEATAKAQELRAPELARELRAEARELRQGGAETARELKEDARERQHEAQAVARELLQDAAELEREAASRQREARMRERQAEQIARSAELVAREAALRATEALRERMQARTAGPATRPEELEAQLAALEQRLETVVEDEAQSPDARAQVAMGVAIEASFVGQRANDERRRQSRLLRTSAAALTEEQREEAEDAIASLSEVVEEARELARAARGEAKSALTVVAAAARELEPAQRRIVAAVDDLSPLAQLALFLAALYAALYLVQQVVILFAREYHDAFSRDAALATGIAPEDPDRKPRVRLDWRWLRTRMWRRWRALKLFALGLPVVYLLTWWLPDGLRTFALSLWGGYWFVVFVAAKSARAWVDEGVAAEPWFLRGASALARRFKLLGTAPFRGYASLWRRHGGSVFAPAECVEKQPWEFAGLTLFRFLASFPLLKLFFRPFTPVASAHLLEGYRVHHPTRRTLDPAALATAGWND